MSERNFYKILGVPSHATYGEIKQAYLKLSRKYKPELNPGMEQWASERLKELDEAYEVLHDSEKRKRYDDLRIAQRSKNTQVKQKPSLMIKRKKRLKKTSAVPANEETSEAKRRRSKNNAIITASAILAVIIAVVVVSWYFIYKAPLQQTIIQVNDEKVTAEYLIKRCLMNTSSTTDVQSMIQSIVYERIVKQGAPQYGITVTEADIDQMLRDEANSSSTDTTDTTGSTTTVTLSDAEYKEWYRQTLNQSQLSEKEFRELVRISIIYQRLQTLLENNMPTTAEQVHLYDIQIADYDTATEVKSRIEAGEDFMTIASEVSLDTNTKDVGGDMGWIPIHILDSSLESTITDLDIGVVSIPVQTSAASSSSTDSEPYFLFMVTEKAVDREVVDTQYLDTLKARLMQDWINSQLSDPKVTVSLHGKGSSGGYDSETEAWIQYQIAKLEKSRGITETTTTTASSLTY
jgi:parvulin-like peptidyl-prolyl isomerase